MILFECVFLRVGLSALFCGSLGRSLGIRRKMMFVVMPLFGWSCWRGECHPKDGRGVKSTQQLGINLEARSLNSAAIN